MYFRQNQSVLTWLTTNYKDVFDNSITNTESGCNYFHQEAPLLGHHIHDIAIRNAVKKFAAVFSGEVLLRIRKRMLSEGFDVVEGKVIKKSIIDKND